METKLPDFIKYTDKFSKTGFIDKIASIAKRAGAKLVYAALVLYYTLESDQVSVKDKAMIIAALGYLISPLDVVPDAIPIAGLSDDMAVLIYVLKRVWVDVSDDVKKKAQSKMAQWFDQDEMISTDQLFSERPEDNPV